MNQISFFIVLCFFISCSNQKEERKETTEEASGEKIQKDTIPDKDKCIRMVSLLPEVQNLALNIETTTKAHNRLAIWIAADPSETKIKYYWVKAGEDNGDNIVTHMHFYVDPKHNEVLFYDVVNDTLVSLEYWRATGGNKN